MALFPLFADLAGQPCLVVGGGSVAHRKTLALLAAGARVRVVSPQLCPALGRLAGEGRIEWQARQYASDALAGALLVIAATDEAAVNTAVATDARARLKLCNVVDDAEHSGFIVPALIRREPVTIAISTAGAAPVLARWIKARIESWLPQQIGALARFAGRWRGRVRERLGSLRARRHFWESVFAGDVAEHVLAGRETEANRVMETRLAAGAAGGDRTEGEAWLVGAGPGDAGLLTLRGKQLLERADVVMYDRLVHPDVLEFARRDAQFVYVGKRRGESNTQQDIDTQLVRLVREGHRVCRLKGGDPLVFARGGEEIEALTRAGLPFQVVPGVTAALACAAYAGIPLTQRNLASAVDFSTGHAPMRRADPQSGRTLAIYMSVARLGALAGELMTQGYAAGTPCAIVENGGRPEQRVLRGRLATIAAAARRHAIAAPAMLFVGEVAALAGRHAWYAPGGFIDEVDEAPRRLAVV